MTKEPINTRCPNCGTLAMSLLPMHCGVCLANGQTILLEEWPKLTPEEFDKKYGGGFGR